MSKHSPRLRWPLPGRSLAAALCATLALLSGCATHYVDGGTPERPSAQFKKPATPQPVQFIFEFQTKGAPNGRATDALKAQVTEQVTASGLFAAVGTAPAAGGRLLSLTVNNVPVTDDAFSKGFVTGLTFGLVGSSVSDGYVCTASYLAPGSSTPVVKSARHAIHTAMGAGANVPPGAVKAESIEAGVRTMLRQVISQVLDELSRDPSLQP